LRRDETPGKGTWPAGEFIVTSKLPLVRAFEKSTRLLTSLPVNQASTQTAAKMKIAAAKSWPMQQPMLMGGGC
jgi:hypothetical protein